MFLFMKVQAPTEMNKLFYVEHIWRCNSECQIRIVSIEIKNRELMMSVI